MSLTIYVMYSLAFLGWALGFLAVGELYYIKYYGDDEKN